MVDCAESIGMFTADVGSWSEAAAMMKEVLEKRHGILRDEHPDTIMAINNLASKLGDLGKLEEAATMKEEVLENRQRILGDEHPHTISAMNNFAVMLGESVKWEEAAAMKKEVLAPLLRRACQEMYPPADQNKGFPRLTVVVVGKRHHTRFYASRKEDADRSSNPKPGTVVDRGVTEARNWDFFLQSHAAIQGTARPAYYFVLLDEIFRARYAKTAPPPFGNVADVLEALTQSTCYTYGRATKAVGVCTPAYYADVVCERARCYLRGTFETPSQSVAGSVRAEQPAVVSDDVLVHERLRNTMFYI